MLTESSVEGDKSIASGTAVLYWRLLFLLHLPVQLLPAVATEPAAESNRGTATGALIQLLH